MNIADLTRDYIELRTKKNQVEKLVKEKVDLIKAKMRFLEGKILAFLQQSGQESAKTKFGTPYITKKVGFNIANADEFFNYVIENDAVDLLTKKVNSTAAKAYLEDEVKIPGVKIYTELKVGVKKS